jgi:hypothetical protein
MTLNTQQSIDFANAGIKTAINHAGRDWAQKALNYLDNFLKCNYGQEFMIEDVSEWSYSQGLPEPPHLRAWGHVAREAVKRGFIRRVGFGQVKRVTAHRANASVYIKAG